MWCPSRTGSSAWSTVTKAPALRETPFTPRFRNQPRSARSDAELEDKMALKRYQERSIQAVRRYLEKLAGDQAKGNKHASLDAWDAIKDELSLIGNYRERKNGLGKDLPNFYLKVPTGGGKTLM